MASHLRVYPLSQDSDEFDSPPATVHVRLASPRHRARSAVARARVQLGLIDEAGHKGKDYEPSNRWARRATSARARSSSMCVQRPASTTHEPPTHTWVTR